MPVNHEPQRHHHSVRVRQTGMHTHSWRRCAVTYHESGGCGHRRGANAALLAHIRDAGAAEHGVGACDHGADEEEQRRVGDEGVAAVHEHCEADGRRGAHGRCDVQSSTPCTTAAATAAAVVTTATTATNGDR